MGARACAQQCPPPRHLRHPGNPTGTLPTRAAPARARPPAEPRGRRTPGSKSRSKAAALNRVTVTHHLDWPYAGTPSLQSSGLPGVPLQKMPSQPAKRCRLVQLSLQGEHAHWSLALERGRCRATSVAHSHNPASPESGSLPGRWVP